MNHVGPYSGDFKYLHCPHCIFLRYYFFKKHQGNIKQNFEIHGHNTSKKYDLHIRHCSTALYQKSVRNTGIKLYNKLPKQLKQIDDYKDFKKQVKNFLLHNVFYTFEEFLHIKGV